MATLGEVGELPLSFHGAIQMLTYWHRITFMNDKTLVKQALDFVVNNEPEQSDWLLTVKCLINAMGLNYIYDNPHLCSRGVVVELSLYMPEVRGSNPRRATSLRKCKSVTMVYHCDML